MPADEPADDAEEQPSESLADPEPVTGEHPGGPHRHDPPFPAIAEAVREYYATDSTGHDVAHVWRVFRLGVDIAAEVGADREVVGAAALTHDLHRVLDDGAGIEPEDTLPEVRSVLRRAGFEGQVSAVEHCVAVHDEYEFRGMDAEPETLEAKVLRDADNLDAMGALGVARTFAFGGAHGSPLWDPEGEVYSQIYHFEDKLLKLREEMHTDPAREIAQERHDFLETFRERFLDEWHGRI